ncbi:MAG TPA: hypothetical protein DD856_16185 [Sulfobacillus sp.]|nr:hypothetical protein [Sulfobacillus sp.]
MTLKAIEWTDTTWNPVTRCTKVSQRCKHCYAKRMARRLQVMGSPRYRHGFQVRLHTIYPGSPFAKTSLFKGGIQRLLA